MYLKPIDGFIIDAPELDFVRCDGKVFSYKVVKTANFTNTNNILEISGGWANYPQAYIDTTKVLELGFSSAEFTMDLYAMANNVDMVPASEPIMKSELFEVGADLKITVNENYDDAPETMVSVPGFESIAGTTATSGKIAVESAAGTTTITFATGDVTVGETILVSYMHTPVGGTAIYVPTTGSSARGELFAHYPVMSGGKDCADASIKGYLTIRLYRARVTEMPGLDSSYKSETNPAVKFSAIDPGRADKRMFSLTYEPVGTQSP